MIEISERDITRMDVDAIQNAANSRLIHGAGVAGAIRRAGGKAVQEESFEKAPCPVGSCVETGAGMMPARYVIHAVTMENPGGETSAEIIRSATRATLERAKELKCKSLALCALGTGIGGFSMRRCAEIMLSECLALEDDFERIVFSIRGVIAVKEFEKVLASLRAQA